MKFNLTRTCVAQLVLLLFIISSVVDVGTTKYIFKRETGPGSNAVCDRVPKVDLAYPRDDPAEEEIHSVGSIVHYQCYTGYFSDGDTRIYCRRRGSGGAQWTTPRFTCEPIICDRPEKPDNGRVIGGLHFFGQNVTFECYEGYELWSANGDSRLREPPQRVCLYNGRWSGETPNCKSVECPELEPITNGQVDLPAVTYLSQATYSCDDSYMLNDTSVRYCDENGDWSGTTPHCIAVNCELPFYGEQNVEVRFLEGTSLNDIVDYKCNNGPAQTSVCQSTGQWHPLPECTNVDPSANIPKWKKNLKRFGCAMFGWTGLISGC